MGKYTLIKLYQLPGHKEMSPPGTVINTEIQAVIDDMDAGFGIPLVTQFRLLEDYMGWKKGTIITAAAPSRLADMNRGIGERYIPPKKKAKAKTKTAAKTGGGK